MAMPRITPAQGEWTVDDMWALPDDGQRYEVIDGVLYVTPSPNFDHQDVSGALLRHLFAYLEVQRVGWARVAPSDVVFTPKRAVQPDVYVAALVDGRRPKRLEEVRHLVLAVEILSPGTASRDRSMKRRLYQEHADEYWIVDVDGRVVERWRPWDERPEILDRQLVWQPAGSTEPLTIDLPRFFTEALGD